MATYLLRRILYMIPIVFGVVAITFALFFIVNTPQDMARVALGQKATPENIERWVADHDYNKPTWFNAGENGVAKITDTLLWSKCARLLIFDLGRSDETGREISTEIRKRAKPSIAIAVPSFILGMTINISFALILAFCRGTYFDRLGSITCIVMMSISGLFYIIVGQFFFAGWLKLFPISGFEWGPDMFKFLFMPVVIGVISGIGGGVRYNRTLMLEEINRDYVRTARAKGLGEGRVLFLHVLKNAMIPILTGAVMAIPMLFMGSLITESFFSIPGMGSMTMNAIIAQDFAVIRSMTYIGAILFMVGLLLTDISYTLVDPRITLGSGENHASFIQPGVRDALKFLWLTTLFFAVAAAIYFATKALGTLNTRVPIVENTVLLLILIGAAVFFRRARKNALWINAWRQIRKNRGALVALWVLGIYASIGIIDSMVWSDVRKVSITHADGSTDTNTVLSKPRSALDRALFFMSDRTERTYSAPMSDKLYIKVNVKREIDGQNVTVREYEPLKHPGKHVFGTDKMGRDVLYVTLKSIRSALIVGGLTTLIVIPFAILFGSLAGFFGGWIDDTIQYIYSTLSSIPWILLVACLMMIFGRGLPQVCIAMGITGWVGLCRVLRAETLKIREREYVQASLSLGTPKFEVIRKHIVPNLMYLVLISAVLRFSGLVLAEAVLSYIGVGVGAETYSWGTMINMARSELGKDPKVWWNLAASFSAMLALVLSANVFGDALRDALDPQLRIRGESE
ncbi:MAG: peptide/nickel transport system permease protein [Candidatus Promineifilaceae bacterium]|jgi:peptide/nickel transport system permease protein